MRELDSLRQYAMMINIAVEKQKTLIDKIVIGKISFSELGQEKLYALAKSELNLLISQKKQADLELEVYLTLDKVCSNHT